jgi:glutamine amidotransferase
MGFIGQDALITDRPADILAAERVIFPGVGAAKASMSNLNRLGLIDPIRKVIDSGIPFLGICIAIQLLFDSSQEDGGTECMGILPGEVKKFTPSDPMCKIPQMGWNTVKQLKKHQLFTGIDDDSEFYFVHSYYPVPADRDIVLSVTDYADVAFASAVARDNLAALQFHPERSGRIGLKLLENFCRWDGRC